MAGFKTAQIILGDAIFERLKDITVPRELKASVATFKGVHGELSARQNVVQEAEARRDAALAGVTSADSKLDALIRKLVATLPAHDLGARRNPLADYSTFTESQLIDLAFVKEANEATRIANVILKKKPPAPVAKICKDILAAAKAVSVAIRGTAAPQRAYSAALAKRDALLLDWTGAKDRFQRRATGAWADEPEMVETLFAAPSAMEQPKTRRAKKAATTTASPTNGAAPT